MVTICRYLSAWRLISGRLVWELIKALAPKMPNRAMTAQQQMLRKTPLPATRLAFFESRRPRARDTSVVTPTPVPVPRPIMMF